MIKNLNSHQDCNLKNNNKNNYYNKNNKSYKRNNKMNKILIEVKK